MSTPCKIVKVSSSHWIAMHPTGLEAKFNVTFRYFVWRLHVDQVASGRN